MAELKRGQLNRREIEAHLKSAVNDMTPHVLDRIDLSTPQMKMEDAQREMGNTPSTASVITLMRRRTRALGALVAACLCLFIAVGGVNVYQNQKVDSVIGIDVNPSVELSVNRKNRVLAASPLNQDAKAILEDMDLKGTELNVAVNAIIGSMVTHGYLDDLDNAILVTVSNDSISKATNIRTAVVDDIQTTLAENQVKAVVYDQQVMEEDDVKQLAKEYDISYGKAYFLKELIDQNSSLTAEDMKELAPLTMEEIARVITERSYAVGGHTKVNEETKGVASPSESHTAAPSTTAPTTTSEETTAVPESTTQSREEGPGSQHSKPETSAHPQNSETTLPETVPPIVTEDSSIKIDYVDYENGLVTVNFKTKVKWKNPTVSVKDGAGNTYSAMLGDTESSYCEIYVSGLGGGETYTFSLAGISPKIGKPTTVKGAFETPFIDDGSADEDPTEPPTVTPPTTEAPVPPSESQTTASQETTAAPQTSSAPTTATTAVQAESGSTAAQ